MIGTLLFGFACLVVGVITGHLYTSVQLKDAFTKEKDELLNVLNELRAKNDTQAVVIKTAMANDVSTSRGLPPTQSGFTLIELMIVVAIIGILAAIALPAYQDYTKRTKMSEVILQTSTCKLEVVEVYNVSGGAVTGDPKPWTCAVADGDGTKYMKSMSVDADGVITALSQGIPGVTTGVKLTPLNSAGVALHMSDAGNSTPRQWKCEPTVPAEAKYLPASCRG